MPKKRPSAFEHPDFLSRLRHSGQLCSRLLRALREQIAPGVTSLDLEQTARDFLTSENARPAFLGFQGYPFALCVSHNDEVVHTFPDDRPFEPGDIITVDLGVDFEGAISDSAFTVGVGDISPDAQRIILATESALAAALKKVKAGASVREIGAVIERAIHAQDASVIKDLSGHGCGWAVHDPPYIFNFPCFDFPDEQLFEGQIICIEPIACLGSGQIKTLKNGWTIVTSDSSLSSQSEKMLLVTQDGCETISGI